MTATTAARPLVDLADEAAERFSAEQLYAIAARVDAIEHRPEPEPVQRPLAELTADDLDATVRLLVATWGPDGVGLDIDIAAGLIVVPALLRAGVDSFDVYAAVERACGWFPVGDETAWTRVAAEMIDDGFDPGLVRETIARKIREEND